MIYLIFFIKDIMVIFSSVFRCRKNPSVYFPFCLALPNIFGIVWKQINGQIKMILPKIFLKF